MKGLIWFDNDPNKSLETKMQEGIAAFTKKRELAPNVIYVSPSTVGDSPLPVLPGIDIVVKRNIKLNDFLIGLRDVS